jgi:hypothetical protein
MLEQHCGSMEFVWQFDQLFFTLDRELMQCRRVFDQQYGLHCWLSRRFVATSSEFTWKPGLIIFALACRKECLEFATLLNVVETEEYQGLPSGAHFCTLPICEAHVHHSSCSYCNKKRVTLIAQGVLLDWLSSRSAFLQMRLCGFLQIMSQGLHRIGHLCYDMFLWMLNPGASWSALWIVSNILFIWLWWGVMCQQFCFCFCSIVLDLPPPDKRFVDAIRLVFHVLQLLPIRFTQRLDYQTYNLASAIARLNIRWKLNSFLM